MRPATHSLDCIIRNNRIIRKLAKNDSGTPTRDCRLLTTTRTLMTVVIDSFSDWKCYMLSYLVSHGYQVRMHHASYPVLFIAPPLRIGLPPDPASRRRPSPCLLFCVNLGDSPWTSPSMEGLGLGNRWQNLVVHHQKVVGSHMHAMPLSIRGDAALDIELLTNLLVGNWDDGLCTHKRHTGPRFG